MFTVTRPTPDAAAPTSVALMQVKGDLTIYEVQQAHEQLKALPLSQEQAWQLDLSAIGELDSAGAQLLLVLHQALSGAVQPAITVAASASVIELAGLLALDVLLPETAVED